MKSIFYSILFFQSLSIFSQNGVKGIDFRACSTAERYNEIINRNPIIKALMQQQNQFAEEWTKNNYGKINNNGKKTVSYIIPVVWHVIHNNGPENLSKAAIEEEIAKLNEDYQKLNSDIANVHPLFAGIAADCQIEFRLARLDPNGNCTEGITRTKSTLTYAMDDIIKTTICPSWNTPTIKYLNIWQGNKISFDAGGYSYYPGTTSDDTEGLVLIAQQLGNTVTHEAGHFLNLAHTWGDSNSPQDPNNCFDDDQVTDTPNTIGQTGCSPTAASCGSIDNVQNYMEYNFCDVMFTEGQKQRMHAALNSPIGARDLLCSQSNLINTGTADPYVLNPICAPIANFDYNRTYLCEGEQVSFSDNSYNATPTGWNWTFVGGTPSISNIQNPTITYNTKGIYSVTNEPSTSGGSGFHKKDSIIIVSGINADYVLPFSDSFEDLTNFNNEWLVLGSSQNNWQNSTMAAYTGSHSLSINNINNNLNDVTELISGTFDLASITNPIIKWKNAYTKQTTGGNDQLIIYSSVNCGTTWQIVGIKTATAMSSAPASDISFFPLNDSQWKDNSFTLSSILAASNHVKFKFSFKNNGGNNFYMDDLNIITDFSASINEDNIIKNINIYPNPTTESAVITYSLTKKVNSLKITLKDVLGKEVSKIVNDYSFSAGKYTMSVDQGKKLASGLYFIEFLADDYLKTEKFIIK